MNYSTINISDDLYPNLLREIQNPPKTIYVRGKLPPGETPCIAIVGTRKATKDGKELARSTAKELVKQGITVVSGLAMGIDTAAHEGALQNEGNTVAVLGNGIDSVYPAHNEDLARRILDRGGAIVSEYGEGEPSFKHRFLERNRIVSGLSLGVIVIEAPARSGALVTARFAAEQGRSVFVFPNSPHSRNYEGSHSLIRDGATLVTKTEDIFEDLGIKNAKISKKKMRDLDVNEYLIVQAISDAGVPINIDTIIEVTKLEPHVASQTITALVIDGLIEEGQTGYEISNS